MPRLLFCGSALASGGLFLLALAANLAAPSLASVLASLGLPIEVARDLTIRRTAMAGAVGLLVTAWVFYRPQLRYRPRKHHQVPPPSANIMGA
jgi:hypothetical protein